MIFESCALLAMGFFSQIQTTNHNKDGYIITDNTENLSVVIADDDTTPSPTAYPPTSPPQSP